MRCPGVRALACACLASLMSLPCISLTGSESFIGAHLQLRAMYSGIAAYGSTSSTTSSFFFFFSPLPA